MVTFALQHHVTNGDGIQMALPRLAQVILSKEGKLLSPPVSSEFIATTE